MTRTTCTKCTAVGANTVCRVCGFHKEDQSVVFSRQDKGVCAGCGSSDVTLVDLSDGITVSSNSKKTEGRCLKKCYDCGVSSLMVMV